MKSLPCPKGLGGPPISLMHGFRCSKHQVHTLFAKDRHQPPDTARLLPCHLENRNMVPLLPFGTRQGDVVLGGLRHKRREGRSANPLSEELGINIPRLRLGDGVGRNKSGNGNQGADKTERQSGWTVQLQRVSQGSSVLPFQKLTITICCVRGAHAPTVSRVRPRDLTTVIDKEGG